MSSYCVFVGRIKTTVHRLSVINHVLISTAKPYFHRLDSFSAATKKILVSVVDKMNSSCFLPFRTHDPAGMRSAGVRVKWILTTLVCYVWLKKGVAEILFDGGMHITNDTNLTTVHLLKWMTNAEDETWGIVIISWPIAVRRKRHFQPKELHRSQGKIDDMEVEVRSP
jgi:hypothetical protein